MYKVIADPFVDGDVITGFITDYADYASALQVATDYSGASIVMYRDEITDEFEAQDEQV